ncbi:DUF3822 family protein [Flavobacterium aciduliphilum]|uniref:Uncharacterized protein DUF3822 n=1 Tax=Flavobacterium aciduliphilum TaxID=1101402 RepID=A0A328YP50_9FLAO|nr:DUF3822 family protein [Flavobacterium aciduliphilum]RAR73922.1 uncharacterized protein DUF3822 [Flavobacterium aciduliphilum]
MSTNITEKNYQKLVIQVSLGGLSFCVFDTLTGTAVLLKNFHFDSFNRSSNIEDLFAEVYQANPELTRKYDEVLILHNNNLSTFVPEPLFDEAFMGSYLQYNTKVFETDFFAFDALDIHQMNHVYIPYVNMNNFFIDIYGSFDYKHANTILVSKLLEKSKNKDDRKMFVHVCENHFEIVVVQNQNLVFFNSFEYKTPEDFIYYILFTAEQLQLNPEHFALELLGSISEGDPIYNRVYTYVRHVTLYDVSTQNHPLSETEKRRHFILLHA